MATINIQDRTFTIEHFRVLIMGRANAGKTTILQKVCNTTDDPEIYDTKGNKIDSAIVKSSIKRGDHDIAHEMIFKSNPCFIFHDSCGFEAGSEKEFESMKNFITERGNAKELEDRIHAIWYCIPMDDPWRTFQRSEEKFFLECDTMNVPVIVIFTKFEALRPVAFGEIKKEIKGLSAEDRSRRIAERVEQIFTNTGVLERVYDYKNRARPKSHVRLEKMNEPNANCDTLLEHTTLALDKEELQLCLISTQQSNLELCIKCAVGTLADRTHSPFHFELDQFDIAKWFPHLDLYRVLGRLLHVYGRRVYRRVEGGLRLVEVEGFRGRVRGGRYRVVYVDGVRVENENEVPDFNHNLFDEARIAKEDIIHILQPLAAKGSVFTAVNKIIHTGIATIIVLEYSAFLPHKEIWERVKSAVDHYLQSPMAIAVEKGAKEISGQGYKKEELKKKIVEFVLEHRMSKEMTTPK